MGGVGWGLAEFAMSRQEERGREGVGLPRSRIPEGGAIIPTQRPSCSPASLSYPGLLPSSSQKGGPGPCPAPALTAASLHIVLSSGRSWSSPGLIAAAATLSAHPTPCSS